eukprot:GEMP01044419.1.p1 GENE.GEMP01044419.1~~GEMP01044419.1.p1  ORF type:complete len:494 (-),score=75.42 GEMP01044419.1:24-1505(-)
MSSDSESPESESSGVETGSESSGSDSSSSELPPPISSCRPKRVIRRTLPTPKSVNLIPDELGSESDTTFKSRGVSDLNSDSSSVAASEESDNREDESTSTKASPEQTKVSPEQSGQASIDSDEEEEEDKVTTDAEEAVDTEARVVATSSTNTARAIYLQLDDVAFGVGSPAMDEDDDEYDSDAPLIQLTQGYSASSTAQYAKNHAVPTSLRRTPYTSQTMPDHRSPVRRPTSREEQQVDQQRPDRQSLRNTVPPKQRAITRSKQSVLQKKKKNGLVRRGRPPRCSSSSVSTRRQEDELMSRALQLAKETEEQPEADLSSEEEHKRCSGIKQSVLQKKKNGLVRRGRPPRCSSSSVSTRRQDELMSRALQLAKETEEQRKADLCSQEELDRFLQQDAGVNPLRERRAERREKLMSRGAAATKWTSRIENARLVQHVEYRNATPRPFHWRPPVKRAVCLEKCVISGLPARYRDPATGKPLANLGAYRTLHRLRTE